MLLSCLGILAGAYSLTIFPKLPPTILFAASFLIAAAFWRCRKWRLFPCFLLGFGLMGLSAAERKANQLDQDLQGQSLVFSAIVEDFPSTESGNLRFVVRPVSREDLPRHIRLTWYQPAGIPSVGETWRLHVRLKRPRGYSNPGGFDFEGWLFQHGIGATGYVTAESGNYLIHGEKPDAISALRGRFVARVNAALPRDNATAVLLAIGVGDRHQISREQWDLYARTGTSHLMAISGLHIGLAATFVYLLCRALLAPFGGRRNLRDLATIGAIVAALCYATVSGFAVPARRAVLMVIVAGVLMLCRRRMSMAQLVVIPCVIVFLSDPLSIMTPGFKLSFTAVGILIFVAGQHVCRVPCGAWQMPGKIVSGFVHLTRLQVALLTGLFPLVILIFGRFALIAPAINMLVLPVFNFITVPLTLAGAMLDGPFEALGNVLLNWSHGSINGILWLVGRAGAVDTGSFRTRHLDGLSSIITLIPFIFILLPAGWPCRKLAFVAMLAVLSYRPASPPPECIDYDVLDVGQGLAVVLQTSRHALLFDTGPAFLSGGSAADLVVVPFLHGRGIDRLDKLIVSHGDLDHAGGVEAVNAAIAVDEMMVGEALPDVGLIQRRCRAGDHWQWNAAEFTIVHPRQNAPWQRNNSSCVLLVEVGQFRILFTGDIESPVEKLLVHRKAVSSIDVVIVPHHGSLTSSSGPFVDDTGPALAIVSSGFQNRWDFPRPEVVARWERSGARVLNTATMGAISQRVCHNQQPEAARLERWATRNYWHEAPPGLR